MTITPADGAPVRDIQSPQPLETPSVALPSEQTTVPPVAAPPEALHEAPEPPKTFGGGVINVDKTQVEQLVVPLPGKKLEGPAPGVITVAPAPVPAPPPPTVLPPVSQSPVVLQEEKPLTREEAERIEAAQKQAENQKGLVTEVAQPVPPPPVPAPEPTPVSMVDIALPAAVPVPPTAEPNPQTPTQENQPAATPEAKPTPPVAKSAEAETAQNTQPQPPREDAYKAILHQIEGLKITHTEPAIEKEEEADIGERAPEPQPIRSQRELDETPLTELGVRLEAGLKQNEGVGR